MILRHDELPSKALVDLFKLERRRRISRMRRKAEAARNNDSEHELPPTATYRKVTDGFRSTWGAAFFANVRSVVGTAARHGIDAYAAIKNAVNGVMTPLPG